MAIENATILVVEDEPAIATLIAFTLQAAGWNTHVAATVSAAITWMEERTPQLVLLDYMLPDMTGLYLLTRIRHTCSMHSVPVIMLTARSIQEDRHACLAAGANDYITKPFSPIDLNMRVRTYLD